MHRMLLTLFVYTLIAQVAVAQLGKLEDLYEEGNYEEVIALLPEPQTAPEWMLLADALHKTGEFNTALDAYNNAESAGYEAPELHLHRGICLFSLEAYEYCLDELAIARTFLPGEPRIPYYFAAVSYMQHRYEMAERYLNDALKLLPDYYDAHYLSGAVSLELGNAAKAADAFSRCHTLKPDDYRSKLNIAIALSRDAAYSDARSLLDDIIDDAQDEVLRDAYYHRGVVRYRMHDDDGACEDWANAASLDDREAAELLTEMCEKQKKKLKDRKGVYVAF